MVWEVHSDQGGESAEQGRNEERAPQRGDCRGLQGKWCITDQCTHRGSKHEARKEVSKGLKRKVSSTHAALGTVTLSSSQTSNTHNPQPLERIRRKLLPCY